MYHKFSAHYFINILLIKGVLKGYLSKLGYEGLLSTIEKGADGQKIKPLVKLYTKRQLRYILSDFKEVKFLVRHLDKTHFSKFGLFLPQFLINFLEKYIGWYLIAIAQK